MQNSINNHIQYFSSGISHLYKKKFNSSSIQNSFRPLREQISFFAQSSKIQAAAGCALAILSASFASLAAASLIGIPLAAPLTIITGLPAVYLLAKSLLEKKKPALNSPSAPSIATSAETPNGPSAPNVAIVPPKTISNNQSSPSLATASSNEASNHLAPATEAKAPSLTPPIAELAETPSPEAPFMPPIARNLQAANQAFVPGPINFLPDELLEHIANQITDIRTLARFRRVASRFNVAAQQAYQRKSQPLQEKLKQLFSLMGGRVRVSAQQIDRYLKAATELKIRHRGLIEALGGLLSYEAIPKYTKDGYVLLEEISPTDMIAPVMRGVDKDTGYPFLAIKYKERQSQGAKPYTPKVIILKAIDKDGLKWEFRCLHRTQTIFVNRTSLQAYHLQYLRTLVLDRAYSSIMLAD
ncbi:MAG: hypothetical protein K0S07_1470 [Chlamydiales bacterium]|jgi:hypothetical protein|nr:hypothetical protein [Chlamydiales bacterium]